MSLHLSATSNIRLGPSHIFYTPCSGIWQSVWIEAAPKGNYITQLDLDGDMNGRVSIMAHTATRGQETVSISIHERGRPDSVLGTATFNTNYPKTFDLTKKPDLWAPDSPTLYDVVVKFGEDTIKSYIGFRTVGSSEVNGVVRPVLNGEFIVSICFDAPQFIKILVMFISPCAQTNDPSSPGALSTKATGRTASTRHPTAKP